MPRVVPLRTIGMSQTKEMKQEARKTMMLTEPVTKIIPKMALPTIVSFVISAI